MNNFVFIDTGAFYSYLAKNDQYHKISNALWEKTQRSTFFTSEYVIIETATMVRAKIGIAESIDFYKSIKQTDEIIIVPWRTDINDRAWDMFCVYQDKDFSFTDCTSFVIMGDKKITKAFSFDNHFAQMGFEIVS